MDSESLQRLEWPTVVGHLVACAATSHGADRCRAIAILSDARDVAEALTLTQEARDLAGMTQGIPLGGIRDLRDALRRVEQGGNLDPQSLNDIAETLAGAKRVADFLRNHAEAFPGLSDMAVPLHPLPDVVRELRRCLDPAGTVRDDASPELGLIRRSISKLQAHIKSETGRLLGTLADYLQDHLVTVRGDRYVLPVRAKFKSKVPGLVHDQSASGQTLFIEPMALVNLNNDLQKARLDERDEIARILEALTELVGRHLWDIRSTDDGLSEIDFVSARARLADRWNGYAPRLGEDVRFYKARHPLLVEAKLGDADRPLVPIDLVLDAPALVVTGPNTGGKTVTLKTLGLCALMVQAGLHPPVGMGSESRVFERVYADIGDEQSLAESLSTFSGHMRNLVRLLDRANPRSLVLLDELGAGTDPAEGAAIARALIEELVRRGTRLVATTHLADLKLLAFQSEGIRNASVEFDTATMNPTYRLLMGVPGHSNAIAIARRLGFPRLLADRAQQYFESGSDDATRLVGELSKERGEALSLKLAADEARQRADALEREYQAKLVSWSEERKRLKAEALADLRLAVEAGEAEVKDVIAELKGNRTGQGAHKAGERLRHLRRKLQTQTAEPRRPAPEVISAGDKVYLPRLGQTGVVQSPPDASGEIVVLVGLLRVTAKVGEVESPLDAPPAAKQPRGLPSGSARRWPDSKGAPDGIGTKRAKAISAGPTGGLAGLRAGVAHELDLRGLQVHEALPEVERFLDAAFADGVEAVLLIHGAGTGALRRAIRDHLQTLPYARSFRPGGHGEGGDGVTIVSLA
jgi:DNA mismatch repair protein MutS2